MHAAWAEQRNYEVAITGLGGHAATVFAAEDWERASPARKVLMLHAALRHVTKGQPFEVRRVMYYVAQSGAAT